MSGEGRNGQYVGPEFQYPDSSDIGGTNFQISEIHGWETRIPNNMKPTRMTERQLKAAIPKAEEMAGSLSFKYKYVFYRVAAGIVGYGKYKPTWNKYSSWQVGKYRARKGEKRNGFDVLAGSKVLAAGFKTEGEAKRWALANATNHLSTSGVQIAKSWRDEYGLLAKHVTTGTIELVKVGEMKSMPAKSPKSYLVFPLYHWCWDGVLIDHEYEYS